MATKTLTKILKTSKKMDIIPATSSKCHSAADLCSEILDHRYLVLKKLGWGHFSTVWLALKLQDKQLYALKI